MTREEILALPDDKLTALVAEWVMGWPERGGCIHRIPEKDCITGEIWLDGDEWRPLESWDHAMMVVAAMRAKGWSWHLGTFEYGYAALFNKEEMRHKAFASATDDTAQRRAVLQAALIATEEAE